MVDGCVRTRTGNIVTNVCVKFNYVRLRINKALGNF